MKKEMHQKKVEGKRKMQIMTLPSQREEEVKEQTKQFRVESWLEVAQEKTLFAFFTPAGVSFKC